MKGRKINEGSGFILGLKPSGKADYLVDITWINKRIPMEIVLEQIRAFLKHQEEDFYNKWKGNLPDFDVDKSGE